MTGGNSAEKLTCLDFLGCQTFFMKALIPLPLARGKRRFYFSTEEALNFLKTVNKHHSTSGKIVQLTQQKGLTLLFMTAA